MFAGRLKAPIATLLVCSVASASPARALTFNPGDWGKRIISAPQKLFQGLQHIAQVTGRQAQLAAGVVEHPVAIAFDHAKSVANQLEDHLKPYLEAAVRAGPVATINLTNPWFLQSVVAIKAMRATGIIKDAEDCHKQAERLSAAVGGVAPDGGAAVQRLTNRIADAACNVALNAGPGFAQAAAQEVKSLAPQVQLEVAQNNVPQNFDLSAPFDAPYFNPNAQQHYAMMAAALQNAITSGTMSPPTALCSDAGGGFLFVLDADLRLLVPMAIAANTLQFKPMSEMVLDASQDSPDWFVGKNLLQQRSDGFSIRRSGELLEFWTDAQGKKRAVFRGRCHHFDTPLA
jgi:hypothetical protein